jgi:HD-GYP domain-containing protein (c-di-GMP phosphodiesterase class II)
MGLAGEAIPLESRIIAASDKLDISLQGPTDLQLSSNDESSVSLDSSAFDSDVVAALRRVQVLIQPLVLPYPPRE